MHIINVDEAKVWTFTSTMAMHATHKRLDLTVKDDIITYKVYIYNSETGDYDEVGTADNLTTAVDLYNQYE